MVKGDHYIKTAIDFKVWLEENPKANKNRKIRTFDAFADNNAIEYEDKKKKKIKPKPKKFITRI